MFRQVGALLATGIIPSKVLEGLRLVRSQMGASGASLWATSSAGRWQEPSRSRLPDAEKASAPYQYALNTRAVCECVAHILQTLTDLDPEATIVSIDGVGAHDSISRNAMLEGFLRMEDGERVLPFVRRFYGSPSTYIWEDELGVSQDIAQGEGGEQGDPLMPLLFSLGQHRALEAIVGRLEEGERLFAYLDDAYVVCSPARISEVHAILVQELERHAHICLHLGKTQIWNRGGIVPTGVAELTVAARRVKPDAVVWRGDAQLPCECLEHPLGDQSTWRTSW